MIHTPPRWPLSNGGRGGVAALAGTTTTRLHESESRRISSLQVPQGGPTQYWRIAMRRSAAVVVAALLVPAMSAAQTHLLLGVGYSIVGGASYDGIGSGITGGGHLAVSISENAQIGVGFDYSLLGVQTTVTQVDIVAIGRYLFPSDGARFFVGGKAGVTRQAITEATFGTLGSRVITESSARGFVIGPTVGVQIVGVGGDLSMEFAADGLFHSYGDRSTQDATVPGTAQTGFRIVPRVSFAMAIGR